MYVSPFFPSFINLFLFGLDGKFRILLLVVWPGNVFKRFDDFCVLYTALHDIYTGNVFERAELPALPVFPSRVPKLLFNHLDPTFIEQRRAVLDNFVQKLRPFTDYTDAQCFQTFVLPDDTDPFLPAPGSVAPPVEELTAEVSGLFLCVHLWIFFVGLYGTTVL